MTDKTETTALVIAEELNEWARDYTPTDLAKTLAHCDAALLKNQQARIAELEALQAAPPAPAAVAVPDERDAYIHWLTSKHPDVYTTGDAMHCWGHGHVSALAWQARAALAAAPAQAVAEPVEVDLPDVEDMAHSAVQEALSFGVNHEVFHRWMRAVMDKTVQALAAAPAQEHATQLAGQGQALPVAWMASPVMQSSRGTTTVYCSDQRLADQWNYGGHPEYGRMIVTPLYAAAPAQAQEDAPAWPKPGDLVRYDHGATALVLHGEPHAGGWHGIQCMGGYTYYHRTKRPSDRNRETWTDCAVLYRGKSMDEARSEAGLEPVAARAAQGGA